MTESNTELVQDLYEACVRGDTEAFFAALSDDIEWHEAGGGPYGGVHRGPDEVAARVFGPLAEDVPDFAVSVERVLPSGTAVAVVAHYPGKGRATGKTLDLPVVARLGRSRGPVRELSPVRRRRGVREVVSADAGVKRVGA